MNLRSTTVFVCATIGSWGVHAQSVNPKLAEEVAAVGSEMMRNNMTLRQYTWNETTEIRMGRSLKSSTTVACAYDGSGRLSYSPVISPDGKEANGLSKRPLIRAKADDEDYIRRAVNRIHDYVPLDGKQIGFLLQNSLAAFGPAEPGKTVIQFKDYFDQGDRLSVTYDPATKEVLRANVSTFLGTPKDPVTLEMVFDRLPDGLIHVASTTLVARKKNLQITTRNAGYLKAGS